MTTVRFAGTSTGAGPAIVRGIFLYSATIVDKVGYDGLGNKVSQSVTKGVGAVDVGGGGWE